MSKRDVTVLAMYLIAIALGTVMMGDSDSWTALAGLLQVILCARLFPV